MATGMAANAPTSGKPADALPPRATVAAGLAVLDGMLAAGVFGLWVALPDDALALLQRVSGMLAMAAFAGIAVGVWIAVVNRRTGKRMPGSGWAAGAIGAGLALLATIVLVPMVAAFSLLIDSAR
jgi:hypothetical protein